MQNIVDALQVRTGMPFSIGLPDGSHYRAGAGEPLFAVLFRSYAALLQAFMRGHLGLLESHFDQSVDVEGDLGAALAGGMLSGLNTTTEQLDGLRNEITRRGLGNQLSVREAYFRAADAPYDRVCRLACLNTRGVTNCACCISSGMSTPARRISSSASMSFRVAGFPACPK